LGDFKMRFGMCLMPDKAEILKEMGYDYFEPQVRALEPDKSDAEFIEIEKMFAALPLRPEVFCIFINGVDYRVVGPEFNSGALKKYVKTVLERVKRVGGEVVVFGSGRARNVPEGFSREEAFRQLQEFLLICSEYADKNGLKVVIEALNSKETNTLNNLKETKQLCDAVNRDSIKLLFDTFHFTAEGDKWENLAAAKDSIFHVHVADSERQTIGEGSTDFRKIFDFLKKSGYNGRVSSESGFKDFDTHLRSTLALMKKLTA
jgi:sugar phosphate isomerase/epimerase